jgi:uncharacterized protein (TIGR02172 family)
MNIIKSRDRSGLVLALTGKLDSRTSQGLRAEINRSLEGVQELVFDFENLDYISSAGLRVLLEAQKTMNTRGSLRIKRVSKEIMDIFRMTGFAEIMEIEEKLRQISIDGCPLIAHGVTGECYKLDDETVLKLYNENLSDDIAKKEKAYAKAAFVAGIPTAISYEVVECGNRKGVIYEILNAETMSQAMINHQDKLEVYVKKYSDICKQIHTTIGDASVFPKAKDECKKVINKVDLLNDAQRAALTVKVDELPDAETCIHGDLHTSNILMQNGVPCLIDMGDFSIGYHMFEIAQIYNVFGLGHIRTVSERAVGMKPELAFRIWTLFEEDYFNVYAEEDRLKVREEASFYRALRLLMFYVVLGRQEWLKKLVAEYFVPLLDA